MNIPDHLHPHVGQILGCEMEAASRSCYWAVILGLSIKRDGNEFCILWGEDLQSGVSAFGETPTECIVNFENEMTVSIAHHCRICGNKVPRGDSVEEHVRQCRDDNSQFGVGS